MNKWSQSILSEGVAEVKPLHCKCAGVIREEVVDSESREW